MKVLLIKKNVHAFLFLGIDSVYISLQFNGFPNNWIHFHPLRKHQETLSFFEVYQENRRKLIGVGLVIF